MSGRIVLVVDDEPTLREAVAEELSDSGWIVHQACNGDEALAMLSSVPRLDALVTDIRMPGQADGWAVGEAFRFQHPGGAIIYMTGYAPSHAPASGSVVFRKPFKLRQIAQSLGTLIGLRA